MLVILPSLMIVTFTTAMKRLSSIFKSSMVKQFILRVYVKAKNIYNLLAYSLVKVKVKGFR